MKICYPHEPGEDVLSRIEHAADAVGHNSRIMDVHGIVKIDISNTAATVNNFINNKMKLEELDGLLLTKEHTIREFSISKLETGGFSFAYKN